MSHRRISLFPNIYFILKCLEPLELDGAVAASLMLSSETMLALLKCCIIVATALALGVVAVPVILVVLPIVGLLFRWLTNYFQVTASQLKRLDKVDVRAAEKEARKRQHARPPRHYN